MANVIDERDSFILQLHSFKLRYVMLIATLPRQRKKLNYSFMSFKHSPLTTFAFPFCISLLASPTRQREQKLIQSLKFNAFIDIIILSHPTKPVIETKGKKKTNV